MDDDNAIQHMVCVDMGARIRIEESLLKCMSTTTSVGSGPSEELGSDESRCDVG